MGGEFNNARRRYLGSNTGQKINDILTMQNQRIVEIKNLNEKDDTDIHFLATFLDRARIIVV